MSERQMNQMGQRYFGLPPRFDPERGTTVVAPDAPGYGHWAGGHNVVFDPETEKFYLYYRLRTPLGTGRGGRCFVAESDDGVEFTPIWEATKEQLDAESIEVASLIRDPKTSKWRLYISYHCAGGPWRVDLIEADHPSRFNAWHHRTVMQPGEYALNWIKDPRVYIVGGMYYAFVCVSAAREWSEGESGVRHPHGGDATGLMTSPDGIYFRDFKYVFEPGGGSPGDWGRMRARINSVLYLPRVYVGFFDAGTTMYDCYEEWTGVAVSHDLERWRRVSTNGPWIKSPHGCIRYVDALRVGGDVLYYYEYTRADGSHELRMNRVAV